MRIHGTLHGPADATGVHDAVVTVRLLDVGRADAGAVTLAETTVPVPSGDVLAGGVPFDLESPALEPGGTYAVAAHLDVNGSGEVSEGDLITTQHVGVSAQAVDQEVDVPLQRVE